MLTTLATAAANFSNPFAPEQLADNLVALLTLTSLEIVLGIDNIVFIAILAARLPEHQRAKARQTGLGLAMLTRIIFLTTLAGIIGLANVKLFRVPLIDHDLSWRDVIMLAGGLFLLGKATFEIHHKVEGDPMHAVNVKAASFWPIIGQILLIDLVFSIDSVITAVGMAKNIWVMVAAVMISVGVMLAAAGAISSFIDRHPTLKMLALSFLVLIGVVLVADGLGQHISKGYIYFAMAFSLGVELLNIVAIRRRKPAAA
jgi:predicted tellurium resistance membrane protein TerC